MFPFQPPLPTASNFPFQLDAGNHTSTLILESLVGLMVAVTWQNAGRSLNCAPPPRPPPARPPPPGENAPAATDCAIVMVVSGSFSPPRLSHGAADSGTTFSSKKTNSTTGNKGALLMIGTSLGRVRFLGRIISAAVEGLHGFQGLVTYSLLARPDKNLNWTH